MFGWRDHVLKVDLTRGVISREELDPAVARDFLGGRGLGAAYLLKHLRAGTDPLGPDNPLIMAVGPLTGTSAPTGGRYMVMTHSPLTGAITCSNSGGHFPTALKRAGWEMVVIEGASPEPVYLWIDGPKVELRSAKHLWG
ncbi:MAG: aldehyde ferredoxin oxidoreductase, partial [Desulfovibrio sp.]|nr:aldehyde ferredoxin oxidoreductase [Desulfovibrio sp.]